MTTPQERVADAVRRGQETVNSTVRTMTDGLEWLVSTIDFTSTVPTLDELVDRSYTACRCWPRSGTSPRACCPTRPR
jgi:hypothetical protein